MKKKISQQQLEELLQTLRSRFDKNKHRHKSIDWNRVESRLKNATEKLWSLLEMEVTGGEPDVTGFDKKTGEFIFTDCAAESPKGRRSLCYDEQAFESRKENKPQSSAAAMAKKMGIELLDEEKYYALQQLENFDTKTSSWIHTPAEVRKLGGALFGDRRYERVFIYHNGAESYYAARGFRGFLNI